MDDSKSGEGTRFRCGDCQAEFLNPERLSEHRISCSGECSQSSAAKPKVPAEDVDDSELNPLESLLVESLLANVDAATQRKRQAYDQAVTLAKEARRHCESLNSIKLQKDSLHVMLVEASGRLRLAIESKASKSERFMYKTRMNRASEAMELLLRQERRVSTTVHRAILKQAAAMEKVLEAMRIERSTFKFAVSLFSHQAENTQPPPTGQTEDFSEK